MSARDPIDVATDIACGVGNQYNGHVYTGDYRAAIELGIRRLHAAGHRLIGPGSVDDIAAAMWREEAIDSGTPSSVARGRTRKAFDEQADSLKNKWRKFASAALRSLQGDEDA